MIGWAVSWKWWLACLLGLESQQFVAPQTRHCRRWTQGLPIATQAGQTLAGAGRSDAIWLRWLHVACIVATVQDSRLAVVDGPIRG
jgi:hypothetical protein